MLLCVNVEFYLPTSCAHYGTIRTVRACVCSVHGLVEIWCFFFLFFRFCFWNLVALVVVLYWNIAHKLQKKENMIWRTSFGRNQKQQNVLQCMRMAYSDRPLRIICTEYLEKNSIKFEMGNDGGGGGKTKIHVSIFI